MNSKEKIGQSGGAATSQPNNMNAEELDIFINSILQARSLDEALAIVDSSLEIIITDEEAAKQYDLSELKLKGTQMMLVTLVKYIITSQHINAQENFEMSLLNNICACTEN